MEISYRKMADLDGAIRALDQVKDLPIPLRIRRIMLVNQEAINPAVVAYNRRLQEAMRDARNEMHEKGWGDEMLMPLVDQRMAKEADQTEDIGLATFDASEISDANWKKIPLAVEMGLRPILIYEES